MKFFVIIILLAGLTTGGELLWNISYNPTDFIIESSGEWSHIRLSGAVPTGEPAGPEILAIPAHLLLPPGTGAKAFRILQIEYAPLADDITLAPYVPEIIMPMPGFDDNPEPVERDMQKYTQNNWLPGNSAQFEGAGNLSGYSLAAFTIFPIRYNPHHRQIEYLKSLKIAIEYEIEKNPSPFSRSPKSAKTFERIVKSVALNPEQTALYSSFWSIDAGAKDYLIVAPNNAFATHDTVARLRLALNRQGWNDTLVTKDDLISSFPGIDNAERIRNGIKAIWEETGIASVLLLGDNTDGVDEFMPVRLAFPMDCGAGFYPDENDIPCDLYYADMDGDWNFDGDDIYGEIADSIDLYADVIIGRVSVKNTDELCAWIRKYITYVESPPADFGAEALFLGQVLWSSPMTDGGIAKDMIRDKSLPGHFLLTRLYESEGTEDLDAVTAAFNDGYNATNHDGHASYSAIGVGSHEYFFTFDADNLTNYPRCGVIYSIGCWPAAIDRDCVAEHMIFNPDGGFTAFIGNSRYGWGSPGNPGYGYSDYFDRDFWDKIFTGIPSIGEAVVAIKAYYAPFSRWENVWRWKQYEINILGEPAMLVWQNDPTFPSCEMPALIPPEGSPVPVSGDGEILVSAIQDEILLSRESGYGAVSLWVEPVTASPIEIAVYDPTGFRLLSLDTIYVAGDEPYISLDFVSPDTVRAGETYTIDIQLRNLGSSGGDFSWAPEILSGAILNSFSDAPSSVTSDEIIELSLELEVDDLFLVNPLVYGLLNCTCNEHNFPVEFSVRVISPTLRVISLNLLGGHIDDAALWGETYSAQVVIENSGDGAFAGNIDFTADELSFTNTEFAILNPGTVSVNIGEMSFPSGTSPDMIPLECVFPPYLIDTFWISVVEGSFLGDMETDYGFTPSMLWHRTSPEAHSGLYSYRYADTSGFYPGNSDAQLTSDPIIIGENAVFSFWMKYEIPTLETDGGCDGIYIYAYSVDDDSMSLLEFVGGGGALPLLNFAIDWTFWRYNIPFPPGTEIQLIFRFYSDAGENAPGFFIDDVSLTWFSTNVDTSSDICENLSKPGAISLSVSPNPFNSACVIYVENALKLKIFDIFGRAVSQYDIPNGRNEVTWFADDIPSGIYFVKAYADNNSIVKKLVLCK